MAARGSGARFRPISGRPSAVAITTFQNTRPLGACVKNDAQ